jgi:nucleotide-binding universal stress UspA family protein
VIEKILVPLDGTAQAASVLAPVRALARSTGASLELLRVVTRGDRAAFESAGTDLDAAARALRKSGIDASAAVRRGDPADQIVAAAAGDRVGLVAMATHGRVGVGRALMGSVATGVVAESPVPVMLLRPGGAAVAKLARLLVPVDGTPGGAVALGTAAELARATGAAVDVVEVVVPVPLVGAHLGGAAVLRADGAWDVHALARARGYVEAVVGELRLEGVVAVGHVDAGPVVPTILSTAERLGSDLIVMSTHALTGPARAILGSVADAVVRGSRRPVLLLRRDARAAPAVRHGRPAARASA